MFYMKLWNGRFFTKCCIQLVNEYSSKSTTEKGLAALKEQPTVFPSKMNTGKIISFIFQDEFDDLRFDLFIPSMLLI